MLLEHTGCKNIIKSLKDERVDYLTATYASDIDTVAKVLGIDKSYLSVQTRILLPFYKAEQIHNNNQQGEIELIREVLSKLRKSLGKFEETYLHHRKANGIDTLPCDLKVIDKGGKIRIENKEIVIPIFFGLVDENIGFDIQDNLHYIHKRRNDTVFHFGLFLENYLYPICYCSVSRCDRKYQIDSLAKVVNEDILLDEVYVITRAFGFSPLPHNMMSKLFDNVARYIKEKHQHDKLSSLPKYIITALNPFLGFNGGIFLGSSFTSYATSPMEYRYNQDGLYLNRKSLVGEIFYQSYITPPILWLARPLTRKSGKRIEAIKYYYQINADEYGNG